jgi:hypothetical protein
MNPESKLFASRYFDVTKQNEEYLVQTATSLISRTFKLEQKYDEQCANSLFHAVGNTAR